MVSLSKSFLFIATKATVVLALILCMATTTYSQDSAIVLDSLVLTYRNLQLEDEMTPPSVFDPKYKDRKVELNICLYIKNASQIQVLYITAGSTLTTNDFFDGYLTYSSEQGKEYLNYGTKKFQIVKGRVWVTKLIPESMVVKPLYTKIYASDLTGKNSNTLVRDQDSRAAN